METQREGVKMRNLSDIIEDEGYVPGMVYAGGGLVIIGLVILVPLFFIAGSSWGLLGVPLIALGGGILFVSDRWWYRL